MHRRFALLAVLCPTLGLALPQGGAGPAQFAVDGHCLEIKTQEVRSIIQWDSFSIDPSEQVKITQPSSSCAVLNDVLGGEISYLMGALESNAHVYIINPSGIIIGKDAVIDVGSLVASTLSLAHKDFLKENDHFKANSFGAVKILGTVHARSGDIYVLGSSVENRGRLIAPNGSAALCSSDHVILQPKGKKVLIKAANPITSTKRRGVENSGVIEALQAELCSDANVYELAINHSGIIRATQIEQREGRVYLTAEGGQIEISGQIKACGGTVEVFAKHIAVDHEAVIDVSHSQQAGQIYLGGYREGKGSSFLAQQTYLGSNATLKAVGLENGQAGEVVVWGEAKAHICGAIDARGGLKGGTIEISKSPYLSSLKFYTSASLKGGEHGELIFDPPNVSITTGSTSGNGQVVESSGNYSFNAFTPASDPLNINIDDLNTVLASNNVTINVSNGTSTATDDGDITIGSASSTSDAAFINPSSGAFNLTLTAGESGTIQVNEGISLQGSLTMSAKSLLLGNASNTHANAININAASGVSFTGTAASGVLGVYTGTDASGNGKQASIESAEAITLGEAEGADVRISVRSAAVAADKTPADAFIKSTKSSGTALSATLGAIAVESEGASASIEGVGDVLLTRDGDVSVHIFGSGAQAFIRSTGGSLTLAEAGSSNLSLDNDSSNATSQAYISAANTLDVTCLGDIDIKLATAGLKTYLSGDRGLTIHDCANLTVECAVDHVGASSVAAIESGTSSTGIDISSRGTVIVQSLNEGGATIHSSAGGVRIGSDTDRIAGLTLNASTANATASVRAEGGGDVEIYGGNSLSILPELRDPNSEAAPKIRSASNSPGLGDAFITASNIVLEIEPFTSNSFNGVTSFIASSDISYGSVAGGDQPMWSFSDSQNVVLEAGRSVYFYQGFLQEGSGSFSVEAPSVFIGSSDNSQINAISLSTASGDLSFKFNGSGGQIGLFGGPGNPASLTTTSGNISIGRAAGYAGALGEVVIRKGELGAALVTSGGNFSITDSESILIDGATISAAEGNVLCICDGDMMLQSNATIEANALASQSIILACGQASTLAAPSSLSIGSDVSLVAGGTTESSGKLQIFSIDFGSNTVSREANLNTGTFSGEPGVPDANNFYGIEYNPNSLPSEYGAPYSFYYLGYNPPSPPTPPTPPSPPSVHPSSQQGIFAIISTLIPSPTISMDSGRSTLSNVVTRSRSPSKAPAKSSKERSRRWKANATKKSRSKGLRRPR